MILFFAENWGTIVIGLIMAGIVAAILVKLIRDKRKGACGFCDCKCAGRSACGMPNDDAGGD